MHLTLLSRSTSPYVLPSSQFPSHKVCLLYRTRFWVSCLSLLNTPQHKLLGEPNVNTLTRPHIVPRYSSGLWFGPDSDTPTSLLFEIKELGDRHYYYPVNNSCVAWSKT